MRFRCDVHLPIKRAKSLTALGHHAEHVNSMPQKWFTSDSDIRKYADANLLTVVTKDKDFRNSFLILSSPRKLIRIGLGNMSNDLVLSLLKNNLPFLEELENNCSSYMVEVNPDGTFSVTRNN